MNNRKHQSLIIILISLLTSVNIIAQTNTKIKWIKAVDSASFSPRSMHQVVVFKNKLYLIEGKDGTGNKNDVWNSEDGIHWSLVKDHLNIPIDYMSAVVVFNDKLWMNANKDIWNSSDGITWNKITTVSQLPRFGKSMVVFDNKIWLIAGWENDFKTDIWSSSDGLNWNKVQTTSCFSKRADQSVVVYNNKLWVIAGQSGPNKNDIWCTNDGIEWTFIANAPFAPRHSFQTVVYEDKIWVVSGFASDSAMQPIWFSDVWVSSDGKIWEEINSSAPFGGRHEHQTVVFNNRVWLIGGLMGKPSEAYENDIWYTESGILFK